MKVAFVVQRFGEEINGGSEAHCRMVVEKMSKHWDIDVLTTCALDYITWKNHYDEGTFQKNGYTLKRFPVLFERKKFLFDPLYIFLGKLQILNESGKLDSSKGKFYKRPLKWLASKIIKLLPLKGLEFLWMVLQGPFSTALTKYIKKSSSQYDVIIYFTYVYANCYFCLKNTKTKSILVPTAHDDRAIKLGIFKDLFLIPDAFLPNTFEELELIQKYFPNTIEKPSPVVGSGIEFPKKIPSPSNFREKFNITESYIIYVGRIESSKGCDVLFDYFLRFIKSDRSFSKLKLVLVGKAESKIPSHPNILPLGFLSEEDKVSAIAGAKTLIMPSPYESLSLVTLEAWYLKIPVLANGNCKVLEGQCNRSSAGKLYYNYETFEEQLKLIFQNDKNYQSMGEAGHIFVKEHYSWEAISKKYLDIANKVISAN